LRQPLRGHWLLPAADLPESAPDRQETTLRASKKNSYKT
jgi:hypothetical protein